MSSTLKSITLLLILACLVAGLTYIVSQSPTSNEDASAASNEPDATNQRLLVFQSGVAEWNPDPSGDMASISFPGHFEPGTTSQARFWFYNPHPNPVFMQWSHVSCAACSSAAVAILSPQIQRESPLMTAIGIGPFGSLAGIVAGATAECHFQSLLQKLPWQRKTFDAFAPPIFEIPPAQPNEPQWAILELGFTARPPVEPFRKLETGFTAWVANNPKKSDTYRCDIHFAVVPPFELVPNSIDVGELTPNTPPRRFTIQLLSATRPLDQLPAPLLALRDATHAPVGPHDPVSVSEPQPLSAIEVLAARQRHPGRRILSGYHWNVTVSPPQQSAGSWDIGELERLIDVTIPNLPEGYEKSLRLRAIIKGNIWLAGGQVIDLGAPRARLGVTKEFTVLAEDPAVELEWDRDATRPEFLDVTIVKAESDKTFSQFTLRVSIPPNQLFGPLPPGSCIVLRTKDQPARRIRFAVTGTGLLN